MTHVPNIIFVDFLNINHITLVCKVDMVLFLFYFILFIYLFLKGSFFAIGFLIAFFNCSNHLQLIMFLISQVTFEQVGNNCNKQDMMTYMACHIIDNYVQLGCN
jgi:hypothetical protein